MRKAVIFGLIASGLVCCIIVVFAEIAVIASRLVPPQRGIVEDDVLGWIPTGKVWPPQIERGDDPVVVILGDSFTQPGLYIEEARKVLSRQGCKVQLVNAGVSGYGQGQQLLLWRDVLDTSAVDHVVIAVFLWNDLYDNLNDIYYSYVAADNRPYFFQNAVGGFEFVNKATHDIVPDFFVNHTHIGRFIELLNYKYVSSLTNYGHPRSWVDIYRPRLTERGQRAFDTYDFLVESIVTDARVRTVEPSLLVFDNGFHVVPQTFKEAQEFLDRYAIGETMETLDLDRPRRHSAALANRLDIAFLDGVAALNEARDEAGNDVSQITYEPGLSGHFLPAGDQAIGRLLADHVKVQVCDGAQ